MAPMASACALAVRGQRVHSLPPKLHLSHYHMKKNLTSSRKVWWGLKTQQLPANFDLLQLEHEWILVLKAT